MSQELHNRSNFRFSLRSLLTAITLFVALLGVGLVLEREIVFVLQGLYVIYLVNFDAFDK